METIEQGMREKGWCLKPEALQELGTAAGTTDVAQIHLEALNMDIRKQGYGMFPDDISSKSHYKLQGKFIVQVGEVLDISRPSYAQPSIQDAILYCQCTDGRVQAHAVVLKGNKRPLSTKTLPGSKLLLDHPHVEQGLIVLDGGVAQALGGRVHMLVEAWEAQQKYGGVSGRVTKKEIHNMGPAFSHFDPARGRQKGVPPMPSSKEQPTADSQGREQEQKAHLKPVQDNQQPADPSSGQRQTQDGRTQAQPNAASAIGNAAVVKQKLQNKLAAEPTDTGNERGRGRRGRGRGRRGRGRFEEEDDSHVMTLEEWEARKAGTSTPSHQMQSDEELARQLQAHLHAEDSAERANMHNQRNATAESLFAHQPLADEGRGRRGRGRGRRGRRS